MINKDDNNEEIQASSTDVQDSVQDSSQQASAQTTVPGGDDAAAAPAGKAEPSEAEVVQVSEQVEQLTTDLQRLQAEFANYKRREDAAKVELLDMAKRNVILQVLPVLDNIDRALAHRPDELKDNAWAGGVEQVAKQATDSLKKLGVERIVSLGQPFDHNQHEAISMEDGEGETEVVTEELQPGYKIGDTVIRHAMVKVGKK